MTTTSTSPKAALPSGIVRYEDYVQQQKVKPTKTEMGQTEFLTLFTTQLKNQNPLDPVKNEAFVAQLAQFSQLEATTAMKQSMNSLVSALGNDRLLSATNLIGKTVAVPDGPVAVTDTTVSQGVINLPTGADGISVNVYNDKGVLVRNMVIGAQPVGDYTIEWDGKDRVGNMVPNGNYRYVATVNRNGSQSTPTVSTYAQVTGVTSAGTADGAMLLEVAGNKTINLADVKRVSY
jgi:flagellar basal-body rod modification protein FlgD